MKRDFIATISHELRTPLAAIYGAAMTLRRSDVTLPEENRARLLAVISNEADRLARIVNDVLSASRLASGRFSLTLGRCDAAELAHDVVEAARTYLPENVTISLERRAELPAAAADADMVRQVLANLVENAVKYSPGGGAVSVGVDSLDGEILLSVRDEGLGIPAHEQERIFEKFYRLDPEMTHGVGGTGLGLYIAQELARRMGGRLWVESREGEGSTFFFTLPLADAPHDEPASEARVAPVSGA